MTYTIELRGDSPATMAAKLAELAADVDAYGVGSEMYGKGNAYSHLIYSGPQTRVVLSWWTMAGNIIVSDEGPATT